MGEHDIEIELRVHLDEESFHTLKDEISRIATPTIKTIQVDEYFMPPHRDFVKPQYPYEWLSIRSRGGVYILNYKHFHPENVSVTDYCDEYEVQTKDGESLRAIFLALGFSTLVTVEKHREVYVYDSEFEVAFDNVQDLGWFIEIEVLGSIKSVTEARERLVSFANRFGIDASKNDNRGYPYLLMAKRGLIKTSDGR
jgi:adenylate cyclase class 2